MTERIQLQWQRLLAYLLNRLSETSTWTGLVLLATSLGVSIAPDRVALICGIGLGVVGALRAILPNHLGGKDQ